MPPPCKHSLFLTETDSEEVKLIIKGFNVNKGTGPCSIPPKILNMICTDSIANPIVTIANLSFLTGVHPDRLNVQKSYLYLKVDPKCSQATFVQFHYSQI